MAARGLTPEQNEKVREHLRAYAQREDLSQEALGDKLGVSQSAISGILSERQGSTFALAKRLAKLTKRPVWEVLGEPPPSVAELDARDLAAELAAQIGVRKAAIEEVLAEPPTPETEGWYALQWTDRMRLRDLELRQRELIVLSDATTPPHRKKEVLVIVLSPFDAVR